MNDQKKIQAGEAWAQEHRLRRIQTRMFEAFGNMDRAMDFFDKVGLSLVYFQGEREHRKGEWERNTLVFIGGWTDFPFPPSLFAFGCWWYRILQVQLMFTNWLTLFEPWICGWTTINWRHFWRPLIGITSAPSHLRSCGTFGTSMLGGWQVSKWLHCRPYFSVKHKLFGSLEPKKKNG